MKTKQKVANEIVVFFKTFKVSIPCGLVIFGIFYFAIWNINYYRNPSMEGIYKDVYDWNYSEYGYSICAGAFGGLKNMKAYNEYYKFLPVTKPEMYNKVKVACSRWVKDRIKLTIIYSVLSMLALPLIVIICRQIFAALTISYRWVQKNKTL